MTDEVKAYFANAMQIETVQAIGLGKDGKIVIYVLDDSAPALAPYAADDVKIIKMSAPFEAYSYNDRMRPVPGGPSVGNHKISAGTVSGYVTDNVTGELMMLLNWHVGCYTGGQKGDDIIQPGTADGGTRPADTVARLERWVDVNTDKTVTIDASLARMVDQASIDQNIIALGKPHGSTAPYLMQRLKKSGCTTETTSGNVGVIDADVKVNYGSFTKTIQNCFLTGVPGAGGDSGSMYLDFASNAAVGLLFAGGVTSDGIAMTVGCRMDEIERQLNVTVSMPNPIQRRLVVDLSHHQGAIDWDRLYSMGVRVVILKVAEGADFIDPRFPGYYTEARARNMFVLGYDYLKVGVSAQAHYDNWLRAIGDRKLDGPPAMDCEDPAAKNYTKSVVTTLVQQFSAKLAEWYGSLPIIYTSQGWWDQYVLAWNRWVEHPLWVASWVNVGVLFPILPNAWKGAAGQPVLWQFRVLKGGGDIFGVSSADIDLNTSYPSFEKLLGEPPPPPGTYNLAIDIEGQGFVSPGSGQYAKDSTIQLQAMPEDNWSFRGWGGDLSGDVNPVNLLMDDDKDIAAVFIEHEGGPVEYVHYKGRVLAPKGLNIRTGPGTNYRIVGALTAGQVVDILETKKVGVDTWARLGYGDLGVGQYAAMIYGGSELMRFVMVGDPAQLLGRVAAVAGLENAAG